MTTRPRRDAIPAPSREAYEVRRPGDAVRAWAGTLPRVATLEEAATFDRLAGDIERPTVTRRQEERDRVVAEIGGLMRRLGIEPVRARELLDEIEEA